MRTAYSRPRRQGPRAHEHEIERRPCSLPLGGGYPGRRHASLDLSHVTGLRSDNGDVVVSGLAVSPCVSVRPIQVSGADRPDARRGDRRADRHPPNCAQRRWRDQAHDAGQPIAKDDAGLRLGSCHPPPQRRRPPWYRRGHRNGAERPEDLQGARLGRALRQRDRFIPGDLRPLAFSSSPTTTVLVLRRPAPASAVTEGRASKRKFDTPPSTVPIGTTTFGEDDPHAHSYQEKGAGRCFQRRQRPVRSGCGRNAVAPDRVG